MYSQLFRNRWIAIAFVALTAISAANLVGSSEEEGVLGEATDLIEGEREAFAAEAETLSGDTPIANPSVESFTADDDLIEPGVGVAPDPILDDLDNPSPEVVVGDPDPASRDAVGARTVIMVDEQVPIVE
jgi:hypothetical protein